MQCNDMPTVVEGSVGGELATPTVAAVPPLSDKSSDHDALVTVPQFCGGCLQVQCEHFSTVFVRPAVAWVAPIDRSVGPLLFVLFWDDFFERDFSEQRSFVCAFGGLLNGRTLCVDELSGATVVSRLSAWLCVVGVIGSSSTFPGWLRSVPVELDVGGDSSEELARGDSAEA